MVSVFVSLVQQSRRDSSFIRLHKTTIPENSERLILYYTHCVKASTELDEQACRLANTSEGPERNKYVVLVIDEMYIQDPIISTLVP